MSFQTGNNKVIVKNMIYLYIRSFLTMLLSIYTSRIVLQVLGVNDYGIYNVVGGIAASFSFLSSMLSNATQRYLNYAIGCNDTAKANLIFNMNLIIYLIYALVSVTVIEIGGIWFIDNKMIVAGERLSAVYYTLHATTIVLFVSLLSSVYESVLIARENMKIYAYMGIYDAVMKLAIILIIKYLPFDKLKAYSVLLALMSISAKMIPAIYSIRHYSETKLRYHWDKIQFKEMFKFVGWNFFSTSVFILNDQGINMLLNTFFGPAVNAARALSVQVKGAISNFSNGFFTAVRPQIIKSYASTEHTRFKQLIFNSTKYTFYLLWLVTLPVIIRSEELLAIWLKDVPYWTKQFVIWVCIFNIFNSSFCDPIWQGIQAIGEMKKFVTITSGIYLLAYPISFLALKSGASPIVPLQIIFYIRIIYFIVSIIIFKSYMLISLKEYLKSVIYPILKVSLTTIVFSYYSDLLMPESILGTLSSCALSAIFIALMVFILGISMTERRDLIAYIRRRI